MNKLLLVAALLMPLSGYAKGVLVKLSDSRSVQAFSTMMGKSDQAVKPTGINNWVFIDTDAISKEELASYPGVLAVEKNQKIRITTDFRIHDPLLKSIVKAYVAGSPLRGIGDIFGGKKMADNPPFPSFVGGGSGSDPQFGKQWGMQDIGVKDAWKNAGTKGSAAVVVAVLDTGVDYTHEDLVGNMWTNRGESGTDAQGKDRRTNGIDDDGNGYIDDVVGWDFAKNDNKPYDLSSSGFQVLFGGNPGHGTHCAGNVAASADNGKGIVGVAPNVKIMAMRFLSEKGQGDTNGAIGAIKYAVDNGAQILSNSWGSEGDGGDQAMSQALQDAITYAEQKGVLFVAAAGNGHQGKGYDNDTDAKPAYPASYPQDNILSVAALDVKNELGSFSNWGRTTVDIGAPGVKVMSTVPGNRYQDTVINIPGLMTATWDGTSMATPHVSGAAALFLSKYPTASWRDLKDALMHSATPVQALNGKSTTGGKLNVKALMNL